MDFVDFGGEALVGFVGERGGDDPFHARTTGGIGQQPRVDSVAGDDSERVWCFHWARLTKQDACAKPPRFLWQAKLR